MHYRHVMKRMLWKAKQIIDPITRWHKEFVLQYKILILVYVASGRTCPAATRKEQQLLEKRGRGSLSIPFAVLSVPQTFGLKWMNQAGHEWPCLHLPVWHAVWGAFWHVLQTFVSWILCASLLWALLVHARWARWKGGIYHQIINKQEKLLSNFIKRELTEDSLRSSA